MLGGTGDPTHNEEGDIPECKLGFEHPELIFAACSVFSTVHQHFQFSFSILKLQHRINHCIRQCSLTSLTNFGVHLDFGQGKTVVSMVTVAMW